MRGRVPRRISGGGYGCPSAAGASTGRALAGPDRPGRALPPRVPRPRPPRPTPTARRLSPSVALDVLDRLAEGLVNDRLPSPPVALAIRARERLEDLVRLGFEPLREPRWVFG